MYAVEVVPRLLLGAEKYVLENERMLYQPFFETAERFISANGGVIGGNVGADMLIGAPITHGSFMWDIYIDNPYEMSKQLTDAIFATKSHLVPSKTAEMRTVLKHAEFAISVNARTLFNVFALDKYRGVKLAEIMNPVVRSGYFTSLPIKCIPEYMQLAEIYHVLYSPAKSRLWEQMQDTEKKTHRVIVCGHPHAIGRCAARPTRNSAKNNCRIFAQIGRGRRRRPGNKVAIHIGVADRYDRDCGLEAHGKKIVGESIPSTYSGGFSADQTYYLRRRH
jgi:hypothetical protein